VRFRTGTVETWTFQDAAWPSTDGFLHIRKGEDIIGIPLPDIARYEVKVK
jgi:hypothetical protein